MQHRTSPSQPWQSLQTSRGGADVYVSALPAPGQYCLAFLTTPAATSNGLPLLPLLLAGAVVALGGIIVIVRVRSRSLNRTPA